MRRRGGYYPPENVEFMIVFGGVMCDIVMITVGDDLPGVPQNVEFPITFGGVINFELCRRGAHCASVLLISDCIWRCNKFKMRRRGGYYPPEKC